MIWGWYLLPALIALYVIYLLGHAGGRRHTAFTGMWQLSWRERGTCNLLPSLHAEYYNRGNLQERAGTMAKGLN